MPSGGLLTLKEAAELLGIHRNTATRWVARGVLVPAVDVDGISPRFRRADVEALLRPEPTEVAS